jgi:amino acid adenylation domain-containing protein
MAGVEAPSLEMLFAQARAEGVDLWAEGQRLRFRAPEGRPSPELRAALRAERAALVAALRAAGSREMTRGRLAENQRGLWFLQNLAPSSAAYNLAFSVRIWGALDVTAIQEALQIVADRHESLRSVYPGESGEPERHVFGHREVALATIDARDWSAEQLRHAVEQDYARPFVLDVGPLIRASLYVETSERHVLLLTLHHIAVDGTALFVLQEEFVAIYQALRVGTPLPLNDSAKYSDFVAWQTAAVSADHKAADYWKAALTPYPPPLDLPTDRPRPRMPSLRGDTWRTQLDSTKVAGIRALARAQGTTDYVVLLSLWFVLLHRLSGRSDIVVGTPVLGRPSARFERTIGDFINMLPLRVRDLNRGSFADLLQRVRTVVLDGLTHQEFPLPRMVEHQVGHGDRAQPPFQTLFVLQDFTRFKSAERLLLTPEDRPIDCEGLRLSPYRIDQQEGQIELGLDIWPSGEEMLCTWRFDTELYHKDTIERFASHFSQLVAGVISEPEASVAELPLLSESERTRILEHFNDTRAEYPRDQPWMELFAASAASNSARVAVSSGDNLLTYEDLDARSNRLARHLRALGVDRDQLVGLCVERGVDLLVAMLGIWKAGGAYVPLDPGFPLDRLTYMLEDSGARVLVTQAGLANELLRDSQVAAVRLDADRAAIEERSADPLPPAAGPHDRAYVIYTSGSTGRPKGVEIEHRALVNFLWSMREAPGLTADDVLAAVTTMSFDIAGLELFLPLLTGARVELVSREVAGDPAALAQVLKSCGATVMQATPATWRMLIESGWRGDRALKALCGGEALRSDLVQRLQPLCGELWNMYGPTETTIWSSLARIESADDVTIGRPIANTQMYVLDEHRQPVPRGVVGELWIGGDGVARSYLNRKELTAERFCTNPFHPGRMYRTGDLARHVGDGRIECLGRIDHQVKLRGYRIELGEIEAVLGQHPRVAECAVVVTGEEANRRLVGYVVGDGDASSYREHLRSRLPEYMVPAQFVALADLPRTPNNKIDRKALPALAQSESESAARYVAPRTPTEEIVAGLFAQVLSVERVGIEDNFFELGGHSLLATRAIAQLQRQLELEVQLPVRALFDAPTVEALSQHIDTLRWLEIRSATVSAGDDREEVLL